METLQDKLEMVSLEVESETKPQEYQGLVLVESAEYAGGTSIKYWM